MNKLINHLKKKSVNILITNVCNLSCGGCSQHCGLFKKEQLFFISEDQFRKNVNIASKMNYHIHLFGGEACLHPKIENFLEISEAYPNNLFFIWTNGKYDNHKKETIKTCYHGESYPHSKYKNIIVQKDFSKKNREFISTLVAPKDLYSLKNKKDYFKEFATKNCGHWKFCQILFYDNYAYACECAGSFDKITTFSKGWEIEENFLDKLTDEDVIKQLSDFCYRCGHCLSDQHKEKWLQKTDNEPLYSISNIKIIKNKFGKQKKENMIGKNKFL